MPRSVAPINGARITAVPSPSFVGSNIVQTAMLPCLLGDDADTERQAGAIIL